MCFVGLQEKFLFISFTFCSLHSSMGWVGRTTFIRNIIWYLSYFQAFGDGVTYSLTWSPKHRWEHVIDHFHIAYRVIQPEVGPN
jgi:hypothetical protein